MALDKPCRVGYNGIMARDYGCGLKRYLAEKPCCCPLCLEADLKSERMRAMKALLNELARQRRAETARMLLTNAASMGYNRESGERR